MRKYIRPEGVRTLKPQPSVKELARRIEREVAHEFLMQTNEEYKAFVEGNEKEEKKRRRAKKKRAFERRKLKAALKHRTDKSLVQKKKLEPRS